AYAVRDRLLQRWISTAAAYTRQGSRTVAYFSAEFLMGPHLGNNLINLGIYEQVREAIGELGLDFDTLLAQEDDRSDRRRFLSHAAYRDVDHWTRMSILNSARSGKFSSGRTIQEYCRDIWRAPSVPVRLLSQEDVKVGFMQ